MKQSWDGRTSRGASVVALVGGAWVLIGIGLFLFWFLVPSAVTIEWETSTENKTAGFNIYRSPAPEGEFTSINSLLVGSKGDAYGGARYDYVDEDVAPGQTYYYLLEEVEVDGGVNRYTDEMFSHKVPYRWWLLAAAALSTLFGAGALVPGLRLSRIRRPVLLQLRSLGDSSNV